MRLNIYLIGAFFGMFILSSCGMMMKLPLLKMIHGIGDTLKVL
jgi:hypothetical protein